MLVIASRPVDPAAQLLDAARNAAGWEALTLEPLDRETRRRWSPAWPTPPCASAWSWKAAATRCSCASSRASPTARGLAAGHCWWSPCSARCARWRGVPRALIEGAAVVGDPFDPELAAAAAGLDAARGLTALDALVAADLVRPLSPGEDIAAPRGLTRDRRAAQLHAYAAAAAAKASVPPAGAGRAFVFRHPIVRRAVYDGAAPGWRLGAHERAAAALAGRGAGPLARASRRAVRPCRRPGGGCGARRRRRGDRGELPAAAAHWYAAAMRLVPAASASRGRTARARGAGALAGAGRLGDGARGAARSARARPAARAVDRVRARGDPARPHADARRRLLAARADAPPERRAAAGVRARRAARSTRAAWRELRRWADPAVVAPRPRATVAAARRRGAGRARRAVGRAIRSPPRALLDSRDGALGQARRRRRSGTCPASPFYVGDRPEPLRALRRRGGDERCARWRSSRRTGEARRS